MLQASTSGHEPVRGQRRFSLPMAALLLSLAALHAHAQFVPVRWANPQPQGNTLRALAFEDANVGYAVGHVGTSLRTDDGGRTWQDQSDPSHFAVNLEDLMSLEPGVLLAVGDRPGIFRSTNGGRSWSAITNPSHATLRHIAATSGGILNAVGDGGAILRSLDHGASWTEVNSPTSFSLHTQLWLDATRGMVAGDFIARKTLDGGQSWTPLAGVEETDTFTHVNFLDGQTGYLFSFFATWKTTNGGASWSRLDIPVLNYQRAAVLLGPDRRVVCTDTEGAEIATTADDGHHWADRWSHLATAGVSDLVRLSDGALVACSTDGDLLRSTDDGASWTNTTHGPDDAERIALETLALLPDGGAFAAGWDAQWLESRNGGRRFELSSTMPALDITFDIKFRDASLGFACGSTFPTQDHVFRTRDGGRTWESRKFTSAYLGTPYRLAVPSARVCYVMTGSSDISNAVVRSIDGGDTWTNVSAGLGGRLFAIHFLDEQRGFVGGGEFQDGRLWSTEDGGDHWTPVGESGLAQTEVQAMHWETTQVGLVGNDQGLFRTVNGGQSWKRVSSRAVRSLSMLGQHGVAGSVFDPVVIVTDDGGVTWRTLPLAWENGVADVEAYPGGFFVCGRGSNILQVFLPSAGSGMRRIR